jgi:hypothetical protein
MKSIRVLFVLATLLACETPACSAQDQAAPPSAIRVGTRFLVTLDDVLTTKEAKTGSPFTVHTLEPVPATDGESLPSGTEISGHVDKVQQAHQTGRARIWLSFDAVKTPRGAFPLVAFVSDIPGVHSIRVVFEREGAIEASTSKRQDEMEAAAAGAFVGAAPGVTAHNAKEAAMGAAAGAVTAFMLSSGLGQELTLDKNTKLELTLDRPFYLKRN